MKDTILREGKLMYEPADFFVLRTPALPATAFLGLAEKSAGDQGEERGAHGLNLEEGTTRLAGFVSQPSVQAALMVASSDLLDALQRLREGRIEQGRRAQRVYSRLLRYVIRMSTRPTPFGAFSGVALGTFSEQTHLRLNAPVLRALRVRPDMGWLFALIQRLEQDARSLPLSTLLVNSTAHTAGPRVLVSSANIYGEQDSRLISLRTSPFLQKVLLYARQPISYSDLVGRLVGEFPSLAPSHIHQALLQLWNAHVVMSALRPPLTHPDPVTFFTERVPQVPEFQGLLADLYQAIGVAGAINGVDELVAHRDAFHSLQKRVTATHKQPAFQVDASLDVQTPSLQRQVAHVAAQAAEILLRLGGRPRGLPSLEVYRAAFAQKYGSAEVPLLELLSDKGLGAPGNYAQPPREFPLPPPPASPERSTRSRFLLLLLAQALNEHQREVCLSDEHLEQLSLWTPSPENPPPPLLEAFLQVQATSKEEIDRGDWTAVLHTITFGGRTMSRFADVLGEEGRSHLRKYVQAEEALFPEVLFADLNYLPTDSRCANVMLRCPLRSYEIAVNTTPSLPPEHTISLDDLVVGVRNGRFYVRSLRLGKEVRVYQSNMLHLRYAPNVCRFLLEIAWDGCPYPMGFDWGDHSDAPFLPRITYKNLVLSMAQWNVQKCDVSSRGEEQEAWFADLQQWRQRWRVPRYVFMTHLDHRLLLDLEHPLLANELRLELEKCHREGKKVQLQEMVPDFGHLWLKDGDHQPYIAEVVVPLVMRQELRDLYGGKESESPTTPLRGRPLITQRERQQLPGDEWTYVKLYTPSAFQDELISFPLRQMVVRARAQGWCDRWFYVRYADPEPHVRIRFHCALPSQASPLLDELLAWGRNLVDEGYITTFRIDSYEREVERYGGPQAIDEIESIFEKSSESMSALVEALYLRRVTLPPLAVAVLSLDQFFEDWGLDFASRLRYIQEHTQRYEDVELFRAEYAFLPQLLSPGELECGSALREQRDAIASLLPPREGVQQIAMSIRALAEQKQLWRPEEDILGSLVHMQLNRLLGTDRKQERQAYALWRHTLERMQWRMQR